MVQEVIAIIRVAGDSCLAKSQQSLGELHKILMEHVVEQMVNHSQVRF